MGHGTAQDLLTELSTVCTDVGAHRVMQISMDGPNVNWKLFDLLDKEIEKETNKLLCNIGSCGLHIVHNSFKCGHNAASWDVDNFLSSLHYLFKDSPARRDDFYTITGTSIKSHMPMGVLLF